MLDAIDRLFQIGGVPLIVIVAQWLVIAHLYRKYQVEHANRLNGAQSAIETIMGLLRVSGDPPPIPDFADTEDDDEPDTGVIDGRYSKVLGVAQRRIRRRKR